MDKPNPGSSIHTLVFKNNHWLLVCNDLKKGRYRLTVFLSEDEGMSWPWRRELDNLGPGGGELSYPTVIQGKDGTLHGVYTYATPIPSKERNECIRYVHFDEKWIKMGKMPSNGSNKGRKKSFISTLSFRSDLLLCSYFIDTQEVSF
jgi:predicted neuraminidase